MYKRQNGKSSSKDGSGAPERRRRRRALIHEAEVSIILDGSDDAKPCRLVLFDDVVMYCKATSKLNRKVRKQRSV